MHLHVYCFACIVFTSPVSHVSVNNLTFSMATIAFNRAQCFVLCDQSEEFMQRHRSLKKLINVTSVQLHDKLSPTEKDEWGCAYGKVFGTTEGGEMLLLWDRKNDNSIYRQYGSHLCAPCDYDVKANS